MVKNCPFSLSTFPCVCVPTTRHFPRVKSQWVKNLWLKGLWEKSLWVKKYMGEKSGRWDAGFRSPFSAGWFIRANPTKTGDEQGYSHIRKAPYWQECSII